MFSLERAKEQTKIFPMSILHKYGVLHTHVRAS